MEKPLQTEPKNHGENFFHLNKMGIQIIKSSLVSSPLKLIKIHINARGGNPSP